MFEKELKKLKNKNLVRQIISRATTQGPTISIKGKKYLNFSSNDYLGLANHPEIIKAVIKAVERYGFGSGASRLIAGGGILHERLERQVSRFKGTESALVFNSGYSANTGVIPAIASERDAIFSDELNHASIIDGCRLSRAETLIYRHKDVFHLKELMTKAKGRRKIVITDTVFSMGGDIAPLREIYNTCLAFKEENQKKDTILFYIDDAHGTGVLGNGKGGLSHFNIRPEPWIIQMGTFSKAMGSFGAFVASSKDIIEWISNTARSFIFSTALPSCVVSASITALRLVKTDHSLLRRLWTNRERLIKGIRDAGYDIMESKTPIVPLRTRTIEEALRLSGSLYRKGIYVPAIRPPAVKEPRIRITVSAAHTEKHIDFLVDTLKGIR